MKDLRRTMGFVGVVCIIAAVTGGGIKLAGSEVPIIASPTRQVLLACLGAVVAAAAMWPRRRLHTFVVQLPTTSLSWAYGTISNPQVRTKRYGGGLVRIAAADYHRSSDGKTYVFTDRRGQPVRELPSYAVRSIRRDEKD